MLKYAGGGVFPLPPWFPRIRNRRSPVCTPVAGASSYADGAEAAPTEFPRRTRSGPPRSRCRYRPLIQHHRLGRRLIVGSYLVTHTKKSVIHRLPLGHRVPRVRVAGMSRQERLNQVQFLARIVDEHSPQIAKSRGRSERVTSARGCGQRRYGPLLRVAVIRLQPLSPILSAYRSWIWSQRRFSGGQGFYRRY